MFNKKSFMIVAIVTSAAYLFPVVANAATTSVTPKSTTATLALGQGPVNSNFSPLDLGHGPIDIKPLKVVSRSKSMTISPSATTTYKYNGGYGFSLSSYGKYDSPSYYYLSSGQTITYTGSWNPGALYVYAGLDDVNTGTTYGVLMGNGNGSDTVTLQAPSTGSGKYKFWALNANSQTVNITTLSATF